jgi:hypothetical protein
MSAMGFRDTTTTTGMTDEQAIERYRYLLATAPPEDIERAHEEAFARLTPDQRRQVLDRLAQEVPPSEIRGDDPASLARTATRAELRQPGTMERAFGGAGAPGLGSFFLATLAGAFVGTAIAQSFFGPDSSGSENANASDADSGSDVADSDVDAGEADFGGDFGGDLGGDFGGDIGF